MKKLIALLLMMGLVTGCGENAQPNNTSPPTLSEDEQMRYDWMAGESPVPNKRCGLRRNLFMSPNEETISDTGTYFIYGHTWILDQTPPSPWIAYIDHKSDTIIKLCVRPDCTHDTTDCNAFVDGALELQFWDGYLYVIAAPAMGETNAAGDWDVRWDCKLIRMDPDGTNRVELFDFTQFCRDQGGDFAQCYLWREYCYIQGLRYTEAENGEVTTEGTFFYRYKLDGSMDEPQVYSGPVPLYDCGDMQIYLETTEEGMSYWNLDPYTGENTYLMDYPGVPTYCTAEAGYYFKNGSLHRLTYATKTDEVVLETDLKGEYSLLCFPDCFILADGALYSTEPDMNLYIYNWAFEHVATVQIDFPCQPISVSDLVALETAQRIVFVDNLGPELPVYYIDKAELGTGKVQFHSLKMPDAYAQQLHDEKLEEQEWFEEE